MVNILDILLFIVVAGAVLVVAYFYNKDDKSIQRTISIEKDLPLIKHEEETYTETPVTTEPSRKTKREPIPDKEKIFYME